MTPLKQAYKAFKITPYKGHTSINYTNMKLMLMAIGNSRASTLCVILITVCPRSTEINANKLYD